MLYAIFQVIWTILGLVTFCSGLAVAMLWFDKLFERVTGENLFAILKEGFEKWMKFIR